MHTITKYDEVAAVRGGRRVSSSPLVYHFKSSGRATSFANWLRDKKCAYAAKPGGKDSWTIQVEHASGYKMAA